MQGLDKSLYIQMALVGVVPGGCRITRDTTVHPLAGPSPCNEKHRHVQRSGPFEVQAAPPARIDLSSRQARANAIIFRNGGRVVLAFPSQVRSRRR